MSDILLGVIAVSANLSAIERRILYAIGAECLSIEELAERMLFADIAKQVESLINRKILVLTAPDFLSIAGWEAWVTPSVGALVGQIYEERQRKAEWDRREREIDEGGALVSIPFRRPRPPKQRLMPFALRLLVLDEGPTGKAWSPKIG
jgi:hypothetical protein